MDFSFNETQQEVQGLAAQILTDMAQPERLAVVEAQEDRFDEVLWKQLAESGLLGVALSEASGGMGLDFTELCLFIEEVGRTVAPVPVIPVLVSAALPIERFGNEEQKKRLLTDVITGDKLITAALSEELNPSPVTATTKAIAKDDTWVLTGKKMFVPFANRAERIVVTAQSDSGLGVFLLDPKAAGVTLTREVSTTKEPWFQIDLDSVIISAEDVLAIPGKGEEVAKWIAERTMAALCAMQVGIADKSMRMTAAYTCERVQFDVPIGSFQAVQHRAADCFIDIVCLKLTTYQAVSLLEAERDASNEVMIAKIWAGDTGHRVSYASQHLHGGTGIDKDYYLWRYCLWARQIEMTLGASNELVAALGNRVAAGLAFSE